MALSIDYIYRFALKLMKKNMAGGYSDVQFCFDWNDAQCSYQDDMLGRFQRNNNGKTGLNTGLIEDETILQKLSPFTKPVDLSIVSGKSTKPDDFIYRLALRINGADVYKINHNQISYVNADVIDPPSVSDGTYYFVEYEGYYYFLPNILPTNTITTAQLDYISTPPNIVWGSTLGANNRKVYNAGTSIQPLWDANSCREITKRMFTNIGLSFKDKDFENFGRSVINTGE